MRGHGFIKPYDKTKTHDCRAEPMQMNGQTVHIEPAPEPHKKPERGGVCLWCFLGYVYPTRNPSGSLMCDGCSTIMPVGFP